MIIAHLCCIIKISRYKRRGPMKKLKNLLLMIVLILSLSAPASVPLLGTTQTVSAAVKISSKNVTLIKGQKKQLKITGTSKTVQWTSSSPATASVTKKGLVTAKKKGTAVITAKIGKTKYTCKVTVQTPSISSTKQTISIGKKIKLSLKGTNAKIVWKSSDSRVASVTSSGLVTGKKAGSCTVYATVLGKKYICKINVKAPVAQNQYVWLSATGSKYHKIPNCGRMNPNKARKVTLKDAKSRGFSACSKCF